MTKKKEPIEIVAIIDRSGSMEHIRDDAIGGFNAFLEEQKSVKGKANLTLVLFDDHYETPIVRQAIKDVSPLTRETFVPRGWTAMNDAIGKALVELEQINPAKAIVCILTDGAENGSKEYTSTQVKEKIQTAQDKGWQVVFLAANMDAFVAGNTLGVAGGQSFGFAANSAGIHTAYASMSASTRSYRENS